MAMFAEPDDPTDTSLNDPASRDRRDALRLAAAKYVQDHPWPPAFR